MVHIHNFDPWSLLSGYWMVSTTIFCCNLLYICIILLFIITGHANRTRIHFLVYKSIRHLWYYTILDHIHNFDSWLLLTGYRMVSSPIFCCNLLYICIILMFIIIGHAIRTRNHFLVYKCICHLWYYTYLGHIYIFDPWLLLIGYWMVSTPLFCCNLLYIKFILMFIIIGHANRTRIHFLVYKIIHHLRYYTFFDHIHNFNSWCF